MKNVKGKITYVGGRRDKSWKVLNKSGGLIFRGSWDECKAKLTEYNRYGE